MEAVKHKSVSGYRHNRSSGAPAGLEALEGRQMLATAPWGQWPTYLGMDTIFEQYPWLNGSGFNIAVIDKGIDYYHPSLGGNQAQGIKSPKIVNVVDYGADAT